MPKSILPFNLEANFVRKILSTVNQFLHRKLSTNFEI